VFFNILKFDSLALRIQKHDGKICASKIKCRSKNIFSTWRALSGAARIFDWRLFEKKVESAPEVFFFNSSIWKKWPPPFYFFFTFVRVSEVGKKQLLAEDQSVQRLGRYRFEKLLPCLRKTRVWKFQPAQECVGSNGFGK